MITSKPNRSYALDIFRGATVALMILVNNPGSWENIFPALRHAEWHGYTLTDFVFPFFLFAIGNSLSFVIPKLQQETSSIFWRKIIRRSLLIFGIGILLNWWPFFQWSDDHLNFKYWENEDGSGVRILGVLQRIAIAYFLSSIIAFYWKKKPIFFLSIGILLAYWILLKYLGGSDPYSREGYIGRTLDIHLLGIAHVYPWENPIIDPEGLLSTLPCIPQVLFGYLIGAFLKKKNLQTITFFETEENTAFHKCFGLLIIGCSFLLISYFWQLDFPYNKKIWSSSFVLLTTGWAVISLASFIFVLDILKLNPHYFNFFTVFGKNPLFIYVFSGLLPLGLNLIRIPSDIGYQSPLSWFYQNICTKISSLAEWNSFFYALFFLILCWSVAYLLDKKKIYIKV
ncbi:acyltransferase family protein [Elizabethkingia sp. JS20170427COW]|uniref:acyltransferase family protein n=1 Tax=Elizabethkingia sp. JS20170427COW TaxID=2583851 RepID=UPI0011104224|nr:heparan-alpha-glucosaminide N-acetyltransferase domain-containing protein [Elizabethkingia sp. JS20170427COW]QCX53897.1 DUF1624 domain-containing protein [Elizabethkingia sp. JS20170427COW]